jgi:hypothetical protein
MAVKCTGGSSSRARSHCLTTGRTWMTNDRKERFVQWQDRTSSLHLKLLVLKGSNEIFLCAKQIGGDPAELAEES